ncbi:type II toxin-antitoxin system RelE/ParE family toxin [Candidatus Pacearchaeota archaeon]|nr:type II toxin-antitoxin system RelE/ParE family toxin [Candidatus Pacearchaeota archaeon]
MMFKVEWKEGAIRQLEKLEIFLSRRIYKKVSELSLNPFSKGIKKLKGSDLFRARVGDYRIILEIDLSNKLITILRIGHRKNIYET